MDIGGLSEREACAYSMRCFFPEFVYSSPTIFKKNKNNRELTDALIWFGGTMVLIESKAKAGNQDIERWMAKTLSKANRQLEGAVRTLKQAELIYIENTYGVMDAISFSKNVTDVFGIVVVNVDNPGNALWDIQLSNRPKDITTLVFTLREFVNALCEFDTAADFLSFLHTIRALTSVPFTTEYYEGLFLDLCRIYGLGLSRIADTEFSPEKPILELEIQSLALQEALDALKKKQARLKNSYLIDEIIQHCRDNIDKEIISYIPQLTQSDRSSHTYREIVYFLSGFDREGRKTISEKLIACQKQLILTATPSIFSCYHPSRKFAVTFRVDFGTDQERQEILLGTMLVNQAKTKIEKYLGVEVLFLGDKIKFNFLLSDLSPDILKSLKADT